MSYKNTGHKADKPWSWKWSLSVLESTRRHLGTNNNDNLWKCLEQWLYLVTNEETTPVFEFFYHEFVHPFFHGRIQTLKEEGAEFLKKDTHTHTYVERGYIIGGTLYKLQ